MLVLVVGGSALSTDVIVVLLGPSDLGCRLVLRSSVAPCTQCCTEAASKTSSDMSRNIFEARSTETNFKLEIKNNDFGGSKSFKEALSGTGPCTPISGK